MRHDGTLVVNGQEMQNIPALWERIEAEVDRLSENVQGCIVHGDLCLSNILYDLRSRVCKLLDPRGSFGSAGIYGDPRYDVAKLYHSTYGLYDFITNDLFHVSVAGREIRLEIRRRPQHGEIRERFEKVFFGKRGHSTFLTPSGDRSESGGEKVDCPLFDRREILLLTGLLFASMPALHYDEPSRQIAMYARAMQLFDELFSPAADDVSPPLVSSNHEGTATAERSSIRRRWLRVKSFDSLMRICIDLDGVVCQLRRPGQQYADLEPVPGAVEKLRALRAAGHYVIISTARHMKTCGGNVGQVVARQGAVTLELARAARDRIRRNSLRQAACRRVHRRQRCAF